MGNKDRKIIITAGSISKYQCCCRGRIPLHFGYIVYPKDNLTRTVLWDNIKLKLFRIGLPQLGDTLEKGGLAVKLYDFSNTGQLIFNKFFN